MAGYIGPSPVSGNLLGSIVVDTAVAGTFTDTSVTGSTTLDFSANQNFVFNFNW